MLNWRFYFSFLLKAPHFIHSLRNIHINEVWPGWSAFPTIPIRPLEVEVFHWSPLEGFPGNQTRDYVLKLIDITRKQCCCGVPNVFF